MYCVNVAINLPVKSLFAQFTYGLPQELSFIDRGWRVVVPFSGQKVEGFVVERSCLSPEQEAELPYKLKYVEAALGREPWFNEEMLATATWLAEYYMCNLAEAMRLFVPGKTSIKRRAIKDDKGRLLYYEFSERLKEKYLTTYRLTEAGLAAYRDGLLKRAKGQQAAIEALSCSSRAFTKQELEDMGISLAVAKALAAKGFLKEGRERVWRNSYARFQEAAQRLQLTADQQAAVAAITAALEEHKQESFLLQGITGSGKTEVYLRSAARAVEQGKQVLLLVPEIALTAQLVDRFQAWFGNNIAVAHSKLSPNERADCYHRMATGQAQVLIGVRSAVFAPFANLGLVIMDEEHETSYKQEERPSYHARNVALRRCQNCQAVLLLGSATPDLCSYYKALQGEYKHLLLRQRPGGSTLPQVRIADMRQELADRNYSVLSRLLQQQLQRIALRGEQAIVLLNRRGYATFVLCRDCGASITCPHCAIAMVYHSAQEDLRCHYCGYTMTLPKECPSCHSKRIKYFGTGTQKAEKELEALPDIKVLRMDQDTTANKFAHEAIIKAFAGKKSNVLIGTQMVAKGHDIPNVTLVGVLAADSSLNLPDYRASERTFALLTQAAGRAGRGNLPGRVVFQAYEADNPLLQLAATQDYEAFAQRELQEREKFFYPPYSHMLKLTAWEQNEAAAEALAKQAVLLIQEAILKGQLQDTLILGPFPALVSKVRDYYRYNVVIKAKNMEPIKKIFWSSPLKEEKRLYFDVDPVSVI